MLSSIYPNCIIHCCSSKFIRTYWLGIDIHNMPYSHTIPTLHIPQYWYHHPCTLYHIPPADHYHYRCAISYYVWFTAVEKEVITIRECVMYWYLKENKMDGWGKKCEINESFDGYSILPQKKNRAYFDAWNIDVQ